MSRRLKAVLTTLTLLTVVACSPSAAGVSSGTDNPTVAAESSEAQTAVQHTLDALTKAVLERDRPSFEATVSRRDRAFAGTAARIYDNLTALPLSSLAFRVLTLQRAPDAGRRALLGAAATVRQVRVTWQLASDSGLAQQTLWLTFLPEGEGVRLAGVDSSESPQAALPLWLQERLVVREDGPVTVLAGRQSARTQDWATLGRSAVRAVAARLPGEREGGWDGRLVIEVPSSRQVFEQVLGVAPGSYAEIAAVAWPEGADTKAALRIVVNPLVAGRLDAQALRVLLTHEATHVATRAAASPAPTWLLEGFADYVAYDSYPQTAAAGTVALLHHVKQHGAPKALPTDAQFAPGAADLDLRYAESWQFCRYLARRSSEAALTRFYLAVDRGENVDEALQSEFGTSAGRLVSGWAGELRAAAGQP